VLFPPLFVYLTPMSRPQNDENKVEQKATTT
jgi:hypothetical protein